MNLLKQVRIFIIDVSNFVSSEEAHFFTLVASTTTCRSFVVVSAFSLFESHAFQFSPSLLKWQIIIRYIDRFSIARKRILSIVVTREIVVISASTVTAAASTKEGSSGIGCTTWSISTFTVLRRFQETDIIGNNFGHVYTFSFIILVIPYLDASFYCCQSSFAQVIGTGLSKLSPGYDRNEVRFRSPPWLVKLRSTASVNCVTATPAGV
jgi:hypothetical protein